MKQSGKFPKCSGSDVAAGAKIRDWDTHREMTVTTFDNPEAMIFRGKRSATVTAWVCKDCGFVEFYAEYPAKLRTPAKENLSSVPSGY